MLQTNCSERPFNLFPFTRRRIIAIILLSPDRQHEDVESKYLQENVMLATYTETGWLSLGSDDSRLQPAVLDVRFCVFPRWLI